MLLPRLALVCALAALAGCGGTETRFLIDPPAATERVPLRVGTIEVREVSLPAYADAAEIAVEAPGGAITPIRSTFWADDPARGVTLVLARLIAERSTATTAAEPWPLDDPADVQLDVRVERMLARADGQFELTGLYAVASRAGVVRESVERFTIRIPLAGTDPASVTAAAGAALDALADSVVARLGG